VFESCCTLSHDGRSLVMATPESTGFVRVRIAGSELQLDPGELADISPGEAAKVAFPVLSADDLTLYYRVDRVVEGVPDSSHHVSVRGDRGSPFPRGRRLAGRARLYEYITGVSSDGLSLFNANEFGTHVLVRATTADPFGDPAFSVNPARLIGWRAKPLADCKRIVTTWSPGGCAAEGIYYLDAVATDP
jgi:hypothetical protein